MSSVYTINKGINKPIEFKGLKAQYITYLAAGLILLLILFAFLYIIGCNKVFCLALVGVLGVTLFITTQRLSSQYGQHGLTKKISTWWLPTSLKTRSRHIFFCQPPTISP